jgi:hypothetical protein
MVCTVFGDLFLELVVVLGLEVLSVGGIGAKRYGTREQCSQKLFELAEIFRKIINNFQMLEINLISN